MIKFTILLTRKPSLTHEQFVDHRRNVHASLFMSVPAVRANVRRYVQQHALPVKLPSLPPVKYDGITELWFDDVDGIAKVFTDRSTGGASVPTRPRSSIWSAATSSSPRRSRCLPPPNPIGIGEDVMAFTETVPVAVAADRVNLAD